MHRQGGIVALFSDHNLDPAAIILHSMWLPRQGMAMVGGATLGLCGWLMQRALRNPLAEPMTLGMTAGATLAMGLASLWLPALLVGARTAVVIAGEIAALACVLALSWRQRMSPLAMVQAGIMINLWCGALTLLIAIINDRFLLQVLMWGGGSLAVEDGQILLRMLPWLAVCVVGLLFLLRPLELLQLPETVVSSLGASPVRIRAAAVLLALTMSALIINAVGVIGFLGLAAPHLARFGGARTSRQMVLHTALIGAGLLWLTDLCVSRVSLESGQLLPVGMLTALTGGPLLMLLARFARQQSIDLAPPLPVSQTSHQRRFIWLSAGILAAGIVVSLCFGHGLQHWHWAERGELANLLPLRLPRLLAAMSAGALLAGAGVLMQRVSGNPLASPEVLGIGGGAAMGVTAFVFLLPAGGSGWLLASSLGGADKPVADVVEQPSKRLSSAAGIAQWFGAECAMPGRGQHRDAQQSCRKCGVVAADDGQHLLRRRVVGPRRVCHHAASPGADAAVPPLVGAVADGQRRRRARGTTAARTFQRVGYGGSHDRAGDVAGRPGVFHRPAGAASGAQDGRERAADAALYRRAVVIRHHDRCRLAGAQCALPAPAAGRVGGVADRRPPAGMAVNSQ